MKRPAAFFLFFLIISHPLLYCGCAVDKKGAEPERKVALVIGNGAYRYATPLVNPINDAKGLSEVLQELGFDVVLGLDLDSGGMHKVMQIFSEKLNNAKVGLFFYAGHGIQVSGQNFLVPVDVDFDKSFIAQHGILESKSVLLDDVLELMDQNPSLNMVFLDACRDNPLVEELLGEGKKRVSRTVVRVDKRGIRISEVQFKRGLAQVKARFSRNMFIAYATQPGNVAADGAGLNSPFTAALIQHIRTPNQEVRALLTEVRKSVMQETDNQQIPWDHASLTEKFFFNPVEKVHVSPPPP